MRLLLLLLTVAASAQEPGAPSAAEQTRIIESTRQFAIRYSATLPNFICTETMRRSEVAKRNDAVRQRDTLVIDVAFSKKGERYKLRTINGKPTDKPLMKAGGMKSSGEFGSVLEHIFEPESAGVFRWERWDVLRGARVHVLSYKIDQKHSQFGIHLGSFLKDRRMVAAYHGLVFVEPETHRVLRLTYETDGIPDTWPIVSTHGTLDYGEFTLNGEQHLLPQRVENRLDQRGGGQLRLDLDFSDYRKFSADATMTFEK